jgi:hypothetical protein
MFHLLVTGSVQLVFPTHWQNHPRVEPVDGGHLGKYSKKVLK